MRYILPTAPMRVPTLPWRKRIGLQMLGQVTPKVKIFGNGNVFSDSATGHRNTFRDQIWWKSAFATLPKGHLVYHTKKLGLRGTRSSPHFAQNGQIAPKIT